MANRSATRWPMANRKRADLDQRLWQCLGADFTSTSDQIFSVVYQGSAYVINKIIVRWRTGSVTGICIGGIYDGPSRTGNAIVSGQTYVGLSGTSGLVVPSLASLNASQILTNTPYFNLTTGSSTACTADILIYGYDIS